MNSYVHCTYIFNKQAMNLKLRCGRHMYSMCHIYRNGLWVSIIFLVRLVRSSFSVGWRGDCDASKFYQAETKDAGKGIEACQIIFDDVKK